MPFNKTRNFVGAEADIARSVIQAEELPPSRAGYIMARLALAHNIGNHDPRFCDYADKAFDLLTGDDTANAHVPPLPRDLADTIAAYRAQRGSPRFYGRAAALYLAAAIDHGSVETFTASVHADELHDPMMTARF